MKQAAEQVICGLRPRMVIASSFGLRAVVPMVDHGGSPRGRSRHRTLGTGQIRCLTCCLLTLKIAVQFVPVHGRSRLQVSSKLTSSFWKPYGCGRSLYALREIEHVHARGTIRIADAPKEASRNRLRNWCRDSLRTCTSCAYQYKVLAFMIETDRLGKG